MNVYAESSAVLAWLLGENRRDEIRAQLSTAQLIVTSDLTLIECDRVLNRAAALQEISEVETARRRRLFKAAVEHWTVFTIDSTVVERSRRPFPQEPIRALDAIHLATALFVRSLIADVRILSLDARIRSNAVELGFDIVPAD